MRSYNPKSTPRVKGGRVQKKNNWTLSGDYYEIAQPMPVIDRLRPGKGYRHLVKQRDIHDFITLLPDWAELSRGLNAIVLAPGESGVQGYHEPGAVHVCAWEEDLWTEEYRWYFDEHQDILAELGVEHEVNRQYVVLKWTESQIRAFQLLHILLHELGHHHDRMTTRSRFEASRGESYAETYARRYADQIWDRYLRTFEL
jgi:hypothetical protein